MIFLSMLSAFLYYQCLVKNVWGFQEIHAHLSELIFILMFIDILFAIMRYGASMSVEMYHLGIFPISDGWKTIYGLIIHIYDLKILIYTIPIIVFSIPFISRLSVLKLLALILLLVCIAFITNTIIAILYRLMGGYSKSKRNTIMAFGPLVFALVGYLHTVTDLSFYTHWPLISNAGYILTNLLLTKHSDNSIQFITLFLIVLISYSIYFFLNRRMNNL